MNTNKSLNEVILKGKQLRAIGFDDAPFSKEQDSQVNIAGIVCSNTRFEGMLWGEVEKDGLDSTETVIRLVEQSKFHAQLHVILFDGIAFGGFNILDINRIAQSLNLPCIAVMRKHPDLTAVDNALLNFDDYQERRSLIDQAGGIYEIDGNVFQAAHIEPTIASKALLQLTDTGKVPEALRLAHLIGSAIKTGASSNRA